MLAPSDLPEPPAGAPPTNLQLLPDASTVSVTKAARILGVHPNTVRSWTQQGRLRCLRINPRGDRRYSVGDLQASIADVDLFTAAAVQGAVAAGNVALVERVQRQLDLAEALRRVSADISSRLDLPVILAELVDQAMGLFGADRGAVSRQAPDGTYHAPVARGLSERFLRHVSTMPRPSLAALALESRETLFSVDYASEPRSAGGPP